MSKFLDLKYSLIFLLVSVGIAYIVAYFTEVSFFIFFPIVVLAILANGSLAEYEDNLPGGFNNPMSPEEIEVENAKRKKKQLPLRICIWGIFLLIICWLVWMYFDVRI